MINEKKISEAEKKIRAITQFYYSREDVQKAIFDFSKNREISPRYFEGFGKRPDSFCFVGDVFSLAKRGATSFHCSEEIWTDPLEIETGMSAEKANEIRIGWDLLLDIDCEQGIKYSSLATKAIIKVFKQHGIKNYGLKFSGSKGFHILIPWKAFPKEINGIKSKNLFPELPRKIVAYIRKCASENLNKMLSEEDKNKFDSKLKSGVICKNCGSFIDKFFVEVEFSCPNCNIYETQVFENGKGKTPKCPRCKQLMRAKPIRKIAICQKCEISSRKNPENFTKQIDIFTLMNLDLILVSSRHLFRMPYSLHEKSCLASVVLNEKDLDKMIEDENYKFKVADPLRIKIKDFMPKVEENEAVELVMSALEWSMDSGLDKEFQKNASGKYADFKPIKLEGLNEKQFPPCIKKILEGMVDGKKRGLFVLINLFRSIGMRKEELEKKLYDWNKKNPEPLKKGYIHSQLSWTYKRKPLLPQNCKSFYRDLGVCNPDATCEKIKNPVNYVIRKNFGFNQRFETGGEKEWKQGKPKMKGKKLEIKKKRIKRPEKEVYTEGIETIEKDGGKKRYKAMEDGEVVEKLGAKALEKKKKKEKREKEKIAKERRKAERLKAKTLKEIIPRG